MIISLRELEGFALAASAGRTSADVIVRRALIDERGWQLVALQVQPDEVIAIEWPTLRAAGEPLIVPPVAQAFPHAAAAGSERRPAWLHDSQRLFGTAVACSDGAGGRVADFFVDLQSWQLRYAVVDIRPWWREQLVLLPMTWAVGTQGPAQRLCLKVTAQAVKTSPPYRRGAPLTAHDVQAVQHHHHAWVAASARARERLVERPLRPHPA